MIEHVVYVDAREVDIEPTEESEQDEEVEEEVTLEECNRLCCYVLKPKKQSEAEKQYDQRRRLKKPPEE